jgi:uncharacterized Fe-S cluster-containing radical SAM superfamily protein
MVSNAYELTAKALHRPYAIQVEPVRGCNMQCDFCANHVLPAEKELMTLGTAAAIAEGLLDFGPKQKVMFAMRGEPLLHPNLEGLLGVFRAILPAAQLSIVTNGTGLSRTRLRSLFGAGVNIVSVDCYGGRLDAIGDRLGGMVPVYSYRDFNALHYHGPQVRALVLIEDLAKDSKGSRTFTNQCGFIPEKAYDKYDIPRPVPGRPVAKSCTNLFRELSFHFNGDVPVCCKEWVGSSVMYNVHYDTPLSAYWYHCHQLNQMRMMLMSKNRSFWPCVRCTYFGGFRKGLLPKLPYLNGDDMQAIAQELAQWRDLDGRVPGDHVARRPRRIR